VRLHWFPLSVQQATRIVAADVPAIFQFSIAFTRLLAALHCLMKRVQLVAGSVNIAILKRIYSLVKVGWRHGHLFVPLIPRLPRALSWFESGWLSFIWSPSIIYCRRCRGPLNDFHLLFLNVFVLRTFNLIATGANHQRQHTCQHEVHRGSPLVWVHRCFVMAKAK